MAKIYYFAVTLKESLDQTGQVRQDRKALERISWHTKKKCNDRKKHSFSNNMRGYNLMKEQLFMKDIARKLENKTTHVMYFIQ